jgi:hypothetical protein
VRATDTPAWVLVSVVFWNALAFGVGWAGERLVHRWRTRRGRA